MTHTGVQHTHTHTHMLRASDSIKQICVQQKTTTSMIDTSDEQRVKDCQWCYGKWDVNHMTSLTRPHTHSSTANQRTLCYWGTCFPAITQPIREPAAQPIREHSATRARASTANQRAFCHWVTCFPQFVTQYSLHIENALTLTAQLLLHVQRPHLQQILAQTLEKYKPNFVNQISSILQSSQTASQGQRVNSRSWIISIGLSYCDNIKLLLINYDE